MPAESVATWGARVAKTPDDNSLIRVLVIDDQPNVRNLVREILKRMGAST